MNSDQTTRMATLSGAMAILLWSSLALMTVFTAALPPFQVLAISFAVGGITSMFAGSHAVGRLRGMQQPWPGFVLSVAALYGYHALYFIAFRNAPAVEVNLVNYLWPLLIVVFAAFLPAVRPQPAQFAGTALGLAGVGIMLGHDRGFSFDSSYWVGYLAALGAALTWSTYSVLNRRFRDVPSSAIGGACLTVALLAGITHLTFESTISPTAGQWLVLILMGLGPVGIAFRLWDRGTKHGEIAVLGTLSYAAPLLSTLLLLLSGAVSAHWSQAVAVILLMIGAWISVRTQGSRPPTR
ncbi:DMT family transporter [Dokdonella sp.]|uniref:aromatic amino acid exporter YddG n=1 Tax=Dokdonella sp. TaxID=2291710 RepID=UPI00352798F2